MMDVEDIDRRVDAVLDLMDANPTTPEDALKAAGWVTQPALYVMSPRDCSIAPPAPYIIKHILARGDHGCLIGLPGSAKSTLAPYFGYRVALGLDVFGHRTKPVPVLYIAAEDGSGMKQRVRALYEIMGDAPSFHLQPVPVDFLDPTSGHVGEINGLIRRLQPGLVILDTIARSFPGLPENDPDAMGKVVKVARDFTMICDSAVLTVHHPPKEAMTPRGSGVLNGDLDVTLYLEGAGDQVRTLSMGKNRNGPSDKRFTFAVVAHMLGTDDDGDAVTAPVVDSSAKDAKASHAAGKEGRLGDKPAVMLRELRSLIDQAGESICQGADFPTVRAVSRRGLRQHLIARSWFADDALCVTLDNPAELNDKGFSRENNALTTLKRNGFVAFDRDWVWTT